jgi:hypothetical protein
VAEYLAKKIREPTVFESRAKKIRAFRAFRERQKTKHSVRKKYIREKQKIYNLNNETTTHNITMLATYICM